MTYRSRRRYTMSNSFYSFGGIGFTAALVILFIGLKLGGVISWSWLWVLWIPLAIVIAALLIVGIIGVLLFDIFEK